MGRSSWISTIEKLIETCKDGENGYLEAAQHARNPALKHFLEEQSEKRGRFAQELRDELSRMVGRHVHGSAAGVMHRALMGLQSLLGGDERTLMNAVQQGEQAALESYRAALQMAMPPQFENMLHRHADCIHKACEKAMDWQEERAA
jgi:uncharacterized protein (TIGR02284 family)